MKGYLYLLIFLMIPALLHAQSDNDGDEQTEVQYKTVHTLKGIVKDKLNGQPVKGATIHVPNSTIATSTDEQGAFTLKSKSEFQIIIVSCVGYVDKKVYVDGEGTLEIFLKQTATKLNSVEVVGIKEPQSVTTLNEIDLNKQSGLNLQDALNTVPGVNMQSRTPWGGQHIIIRGYYPSADNGRSNSENFGGMGYQMFINNIPITDASGTTLMDDIDYSTLGKVEIEKGPSPLYGSYIAGAVNLYTPHVAPNQTSINEEAIAGSYGLFRTNTSIATSDGKADFWANYGHQTYDGFRPHDASRKDFASFASNYYVSDKQVVSTYFSYAHSNEQLAGEIDSADLYGRKAVSDSNYVGNNSHVDIESFRGGLTDKYQYNSHFSSLTSVFVSGSALNQAYAHGFTKTESLNFGGRTAISYDNNNSDKLNVKGVLGADFRKSYQNTQGDFFLPFIKPPLDTSKNYTPSDAQNIAMTYNIFTQWTFRLPAPQFSLAVGGSLNFVEFSTQNLLPNKKTVFANASILQRVFSPTFTPDISLIKTFNRNISVYASVSAGYVPPTFAEMVTSAGAANINLKPERAIQYEIGTKGSYGEHQQLTYQLALYDLDITDRLTPVTANSITAFTNVGEQRNMGAELYVSYTFIKNKNKAISLLRPWLSYTYTNAQYVNFKNHTQAKIGGADSIVANYSNNKVAGVAPNMFNLGVDIASKYGIYLFASYQYMDKVPVTFDNSTYMKSYDLLRARIGYKYHFNKHFSGDIFAGADNLLGSTYYSFLFVGQNIQELAQGNDLYVKGGGGDGYILPAPYNATFYGGLSFNYKF